MRKNGKMKTTVMNISLMNVLGFSSLFNDLRVLKSRLLESKKSCLKLRTHFKLDCRHLILLLNMLTCF